MSETTPITVQVGNPSAVPILIHCECGEDAQGVIDLLSIGARSTVQHGCGRTYLLVNELGGIRAREVEQ